MPLLLWGSPFTADVKKKKAHVGPEVGILHGKSEGDGRRWDHAALHHLRKLEEG